MKINYNKHIWEGWLVIDFINEIEQSIDFQDQKFTSKQQLKEFCKDNQPYYKKHIPEVVNHFAQKYNLK